MRQHYFFKKPLQLEILVELAQPEAWRERWRRWQGIEAQTWSEIREELHGLDRGVGGKVARYKPRKEKSLKLGTL